MGDYHEARCEWLKSSEALRKLVPASGKPIIVIVNITNFFPYTPAILFQRPIAPVSLRNGFQIDVCAVIAAQLAVRLPQSSTKLSPTGLVLIAAKNLTTRVPTSSTHSRPETSIHIDDPQTPCYGG